MALIDQTYFILDLSLPLDNYSDIDLYIDRYEPEILRELLGIELANLVLSYDPATSDQRIIDLVKGGTYSDETGKVRYWDGLVNDGKKSLIANYVYTKYLQDKLSTTTTSGEILGAVENAVHISPAMKYWRATRKLVEMATDMFGFIEANESDYPEFERGDLSKYKSVNAFDL